MDNQDKFYKEIESDAFFDRWRESLKGKKIIELRESKKEILNQLIKVKDISSQRVLEVGCFISDFLWHLQSKYDCDIFGIESSSKACDYAKNKFNLDIENSTLAKSKFFSLDNTNRHRFDMIICDDVLSWISRDLILPSLGVLDWLLKPQGILFLRDFSPAFGFAYENHHHPGNNIFNFKQPGGHRQYFLNTGKYLEHSTLVKTLHKTDKTYQKVRTVRADSMTWADSVLIKLQGTLHPVETLS